MPTTPEPETTRARTPSAPLHGPDYDNYEPYPPRRSTRSTAQNSPYSSFNSERSPRSHLQRHTTPPPTVKKARFSRTTIQLSSPPSSPASLVRTRHSPQKPHKTPRKAPTPISHARKIVNSLSDSDHAPSSSLAPSTIDPTTMLPTPSKTPKKRNAAAIHPTARILSFQPNNLGDAMPSARKIKKHGRFNSVNGFDLYDEDMGAQADSSIPIYTDANARVPEMDVTEDNPFVGPRRSNPSRPQRKGRKARTDADVEMEDAAERDEGVVYVFRGKKIFRRFSDPEQDRSSSPGTDISDIPGQRTLKRQAGSAAHRPLTRSSIKPRLLFPSEEQLREREQAADDVDEEALTDIEMPNAHSPIKEKGKAHEVQTPTKDRFKPTTPPTTTTRAARSRRAVVAGQPTPIFEQDDEEPEPEPMSLGTDDSCTLLRKGSSKSPFDAWPRTKAGRKRAGEASEAAGSGKRTRNSGLESPA